MRLKESRRRRRMKRRKQSKAKLKKERENIYAAAKITSKISLS
jgi:hypothetical protein